jgi:hypothetical protein
VLLPDPALLPDPTLLPRSRAAAQPRALHPSASLLASATGRHAAAAAINSAAAPSPPAPPTPPQTAGRATPTEHHPDAATITLLPEPSRRLAARRVPSNSPVAATSLGRHESRPTHHGHAAEPPLREENELRVLDSRPVPPRVASLPDRSIPTASLPLSSHRRPNSGRIKPPNRPCRRPHVDRVLGPAGLPPPPQL